ncbi:MAG: HD domain-containing phosphohydrolase [Bacillota bacterium]
MAIRRRVSSKRSEFNLFGVLDAFPFYVMLINKHHRILLANEAVRTQLGVELGGIIGAPCNKVVHGADGPYPGCPLEEAVRKGTTVESEVFDLPSGRWISSAIYPTSLRDSDGEALYLHMTYDITERKNGQEALRQSLTKLERITEGVIKALTRMVESRDPYTAGHQQRVSNLACEIAREMNLPDDHLEGIRVAGLVHDLGKMAVPIEILSKPGHISVPEMNVIRHHVQAGYDILQDVEFPWPVADIVLQHHERLNGSGYPHARSGGDIMIQARILGVADVVEAMSSRRPYREALGLERALDEVLQNRGSLYDPEVSDACSRLFASGDLDLSSFTQKAPPRLMASQSREMGRGM